MCVSEGLPNAIIYQENLPTGINKVTLKEGRTADHVHDAHFISYTRLVLGLVHIDMAQWACCHVQETCVLWHGVLSLSSCQKILSGRKWMEMVSSNTQVVLRTLKCAVKTSPTPLHLCHQPELLIWSSFPFVYCWPYHLNVAVEIETQQIRWHFPVFCSSGEFSALSWQEWRLLL